MADAPLDLAAVRALHATAARVRTAHPNIKLEDTEQLFVSLGIALAALDAAQERIWLMRRVEREDQAALDAKDTGWQETAAEYARNVDYYRGLVEQIGGMLGEAAYVSDDGSRQQDVLCAKVPELVRAALDRLNTWVHDLQSGMYINCVYCGHRYGPEDQVPATMSQALKDHIEQCPEHPMSALKRQLDRVAGITGEEVREAIACADPDCGAFACARGQARLLRLLVARRAGA